MFAFNTAGDSAPSNVATVLMPPSSPNSFAGTRSSSSQIDFTWTNTASTQSSFRIERRVWGSGATFTAVASVGGTATSYSDTTATWDVAYEYRIFAVNAGGDSPVSNSAFFQSIPTAPTTLTATAASGGPAQVTLSWKNTATNQTGFSIQRRQGSAAFTQVGVAGIYDKTYVDTAVYAGESYDYQVVATNAVGPSPPSNTASAQTVAAPPFVTLVNSEFGLEAGGTNVTITGSNFPDPRTLPAPQVMFGPHAATNVQVLSNSVLTCTTPAGDRHVGGDVDVTVTDAQGSGTLPSGFTYATGLIQQSFATGPLDPALNDSSGGTYWTFANGGLTRVNPGYTYRKYITTVATDFIQRDFAFEITIKNVSNIVFSGIGTGLPDGPNNDEPLLAANFRLHQPGLVGGRTDVVIRNTPFFAGGSPGSVSSPGPYRMCVRKTGNKVTFWVRDPANLTPLLTYAFDNIGTAAPFMDATNSRLFFGNQDPGEVWNDIVIATIRQQPLSVLRATPSSGPQAGQTQVTITGNGFMTGGPITGVAFGSAAATNVSVVDDHTITCTSPAGSNGPADVVVSNSTSSGTSAGAFLYTGAFFTDSFNEVTLNPNLEDPIHSFAVQSGALVKVEAGSDRRFVRTYVADYSKRDFTYDIAVRQAGFGAPQFVGIGAAATSNPGTLLPAQAVGVRFVGTNADMFVDDGTTGTVTAITTGSIGVRQVRLQKRGDQLTITVDGVSTTISSLSTTAPFLATGDSKLFMTADTPDSGYGPVSIQP